MAERLAPPIVHVRADPGSTLRDAAARIAAVAEESVARSGRFRWVLAGGRTPERLYERLAQSPRRFPWERTELFFGDERCVPPVDPRSNFGMVRRTLLSRAPVRPGLVHRMPGELRPPRTGVDGYSQLLGRLAFGGGRPWFDLVLLGLGPDGHTASLFPGDPAVLERSRPVVYVGRAGQPPAVPRMTLTLPALNSGRIVCFLAVGPEKAAAAAAILRRSLRRAPSLPAGEVHGREGTFWYLDAAAGSGLNARPIQVGQRSRADRSAGPSTSRRDRVSLSGGPDPPTIGARR